MKRLFASIILVTALACANGPSAQKTLDVAEDALTTACEQAMSPSVASKLTDDKIKQVATACAAGGRASLAAQSAYQMSEQVPADQQQDWLSKMQLSLDILKTTTAEVLSAIGAK